MIGLCIIAGWTAVFFMWISIVESDCPRYALIEKGILRLSRLLRRLGLAFVIPAVMTITICWALYCGRNSPPDPTIPQSTMTFTGLSLVSTVLTIICGTFAIGMTLILPYLKRLLLWSERTIRQQARRAWQQLVKIPIRW